MPPKKKKKKTPTPRIPNVQRMRYDDVPATVGLVKEVRSELLAETRSMRHDMRSVHHELDGKIESFRHELNGKIEFFWHELNGKIEQVHSKVEQVNSKVEQIQSTVHGMKVLMEEQRGDNKIVLDGIQSVMERQDRMEQAHQEFRTTLQILVEAKALPTRP